MVNIFGRGDKNYLCLDTVEFLLDGFNNVSEKLFMSHKYLGSFSTVNEEISLINMLVVYIKEWS